MERDNNVPVRTVSLRPEKNVDHGASVTAEQILKQEGVTVVVETDREQAEEAVVDLVVSGNVMGLDIETAKVAPFEENEKAGLDPHLSRIALQALGYSEKEADWATKQLPKDVGVSEGIRQALKFLSKP